MSRALTISAGAHGLLILWAVMGGFSRPPRLPDMTVADVTVLSEAEFEALAQPNQSPPDEAPTVQSSADAGGAPPPAPEPAPEIAPPPVVPPAPTPPAEPLPAPQPDAPAPQPATPVPPPPPAAPAPAEAPVLSDEVQSSTGERIAPDPVPVSPQPVQDPTATVPPVADSGAETGDAPPPVPSEAAPPPAATELLTETARRATAPTQSLRPRARPERPAPQPDPAPTEVAEAPDTPAPTPEPRPEPQPETPPETPPAQIQDDISAALAGVLGTAETPAAPQTDAPAGPPLTRSEREGLRIGVQRCWVVDPGSLSANVTVTVGFELARNGTVQAGSIRLLDSTGGQGAAIDTAYNAARRAILRCQGEGYALPAEKYDHWKEVEITFNPNEMRTR